MNYLNTGAIQACLSGNKPTGPFSLQILHIKGVAAPQSPTPARFKMLLTDGKDLIPAICATQLNDEINSGNFKAFSVVQILNHSINDVQGQKVLIIVSMELVIDMPGQIPPFHIEKDGYVTAGGGAGAPPQQQQQQQQMYQQQAPAAAPPATNPYAAPASNPYKQEAPPTSSSMSNPYGGSSAGYSVGNSRPVVRAEAGGMDHNVVPIGAINPYSSRCTIKARITAKSDIRRWSNAKGDGTLFSVDLLDAAGGEIRGTFFKEACEKFFPVLQEGKVYFMTGFKAKLVTNKQYSSIKNNYEITFDTNSDIRAANDDADIKAQVFSFVKINSLPQIEKDQTIDLIAIVRSAGERSEIVSSKMGGRTLVKRELTLVDETLNEVRMTLWGEKADQAIPWHESPIVAFKGVRVGDYGGRSLSMSQSSSWLINPNIPEGFALHSWRQSQGGVVPTGTSLSTGAGSGGGSEASFESRKPISAIKDEHLGGGEKADFITVKGTVSYIKSDNDPWYCACPSDNCNKKVIESMNNKWSCEKCNQVFDECQRRYILSLVMTDSSGNNWFSLFNDTAEMLLNSSAQNVYQMKAEGDEASAAAVFKNALFKSYIAKVRVKQEFVNDEMRVKSTVVGLNEIDYVTESSHMIDAIAKYQ